MGNSSSSMNTNAYGNLNAWNAEYISLTKTKLQRKFKSSTKKPIALIVQDNENNKIIPKDLKLKLQKEINSLALKTDNYRCIDFIFNHEPLSRRDDVYYYQREKRESMSDDSDHEIKPIIQDLIDPFLNLNIHIDEQKEKEEENKKDIQWMPVLFEYDKKSNEYIIRSEINSIPYYQHKSLYNIIENIFNKTIPMFQYILKIKNLPKKYKKLYVIVKCQKYIFEDNMEYFGGWHCEGSIYDHYIIANALYYFDKDEFITDKLHICAKIALRTGRCGSQWMEDDVIDINVKNDMFVCFDNKETIHRVQLKVDGKKQRKLLAFFLIDPDRENQISLDDIKMVNWIYKTQFIVLYWFRCSCVGYVNLNQKQLTIPIDILFMIDRYVCGNDTYLKQLSDDFRKQHPQYLPRPSGGNRWNVMSGAD